MFIRQIFVDAGIHIINLAGLIRLSIDGLTIEAKYAATEEQFLDYKTEDDANKAFELIKKQLCKDPDLKEK